MEDGYYALSVARNFAEGNGITIDGTQITNGFQPLFTFVAVPAFLIAGENKFNLLIFLARLPISLLTAISPSVNPVTSGGVLSYMFHQFLYCCEFRWS